MGKGMHRIVLFFLLFTPQGCWQLLSQWSVCGYLFTCNLLESWPLSFFSEKPFTILFMSTCLSSTYLGTRGLVLHTVTKCYSNTFSKGKNELKIITLVSVTGFNGLKAGARLKQLE